MLTIIEVILALFVIRINYTVYVCVYEFHMVKLESVSCFLVTEKLKTVDICYSIFFLIFRI